MSGKPAHRVGPHSRLNRLGKLDGRTRAAAHVRRVRAELTAHCGGDPTAIQRALIERCCWLSLRVELLDRKIASGSEFTQMDSATYLAWSNSLSRTLDKLGITGAAAEPQPSHFDTIMREVEGDVA